MILQAKKERALRANRDPEAQEDLNNKMAEETVYTEALEMGVAATSIARNIPPHDMSATIPQQAYPLEKIIFKGEWRYLLDIAELLQQGKDIKSGSYPLFVCNRIHKIEEVKVKILHSGFMLYSSSTMFSCILACWVFEFTFQDWLSHYCDLKSQ